jgi:hypothetical protein
LRLWGRQARTHEMWKRASLFKVIGDSHSMYCFAAIREARIRYLPLLTAHRVGRDGIMSVIPTDFQIGDGDRLITSFGEIDCRAHVENIAARRGLSAEAILDDLADRYTAALRVLSARGVEVWVSCVIPPSRRSQMDETAIRAQVSIRRALNERLALRAADRGLGFLDFYDRIAGPDGVLPNRASAPDGFHVDANRVDAIREVVSSTLGIRLHRRWLIGEPKRYGGHMPWLRRSRKALTDPPRLFFRRFFPQRIR